MKKLLLILLLFSFASCAGQRIEQSPLYRHKAIVKNVIGETAVLSLGGYETIEVPAGDFEKNKQYMFWLEAIEKDSKGRITKAIVVKYAMTQEQARKDMETAAKELSNRKIIKPF